VASSQSLHFHTKHKSKILYRRDINEILLKVALNTISNHYILYDVLIIGHCINISYCKVQPGQITFWVKIFFLLGLATGKKTHTYLSLPKG
jgi:hypothetical protein